jgi:general secretion pathway protein A
VYLNYYLLRQPPFGITPDPDFFYLSPSHREALAAILYGVENRRGFIAVTGEVGTGKTTVLRALLQRTKPDRVKTVYLFNPDVSFQELLRAVFLELGLQIPVNDIDLAVRHLHRYLIECYRQGMHVVLFVDEAQQMPVETLERMRVLSNLETGKEKLLQIVLSGQPELEAKLARHELRQLHQRIAVWARLRPLTRKEACGYIDHRLGRVQYGNTPVFNKAALRRIVRHARGVPRVINMVCENALVIGYGRQCRPIGRRVVREVIREQRRNARRGLWRNLRSALGSLWPFGRNRLLGN